MHERVREPVLLLLTRVLDRLDKIDGDEVAERGLRRFGIGRNGEEERLVEDNAEDGGLLEQASSVFGDSVDAGEKQPLQRGRHVHRLASRCAYPATALMNEHSRAHQVTKDLLNE
jgi:hypothetical protein